MGCNGTNEDFPEPNPSYWHACDVIRSDRWFDLFHLLALFILSPPYEWVGRQAQGAILRRLGFDFWTEKVVMASKPEGRVLGVFE